MVSRYSNNPLEQASVVFNRELSAQADVQVPRQYCKEIIVPFPHELEQFESVFGPQYEGVPKCSLIKIY